MNLSQSKNFTPYAFETTWTAPSNIAFVKYWGKKGIQLPCNPSLSMTLQKCSSTTKVQFFPSEKLTVELKLDGKREEKFAQKIFNYLLTLKGELPWAQNLKIEIETSNTFPHGTGIASSASGLAAFALCLTDYYLRENHHHLDFNRTASFLSRLASGSACRSIFGGFSSWGASLVPGSSDEFATPISVHRELEGLRDSVLIISDEEKEVSSSLGHQKMGEHLFAESRYQQARHNYKFMLDALKSGDINQVGDILEMEALSLHAMMMTSRPGFILMKPQTISGIELIRAFRKETKLPLYFTLDAGPNLHLIFPKSVEASVMDFINSELTPLSQSVIHDSMGEGPVKC